MAACRRASACRHAVAWLNLAIPTQGPAWRIWSLVLSAVCGDHIPGEARFQIVFHREFVLSPAHVVDLGRWGWMLRTFATAALLLAFTGLAGPAAAQEVVGIVCEWDSGVGIAGVEVVLLDTAGVAESRAITDAEGRFVIPATRSGAFTLSFFRIGYQAFTSEPIDILTGERLVAEIRLGVEAVPLDALIVSGRARQHPPDIEAFYQRLEFGRRSSDGYFISRADMESTHPARTTDLLRSVNGVQVVHRRGGRDTVVLMRGGCVPAIYIDGSHINRVDTQLSLDDYVAPSSIEGIEVYRGAGRAVGHFHDPRGCGLILVWTLRGVRGDSGPVRWKTMAAVLVALLGLLFILN